jgi:hypothetical protein
MSMGIPQTMESFVTVLGLSIAMGMYIYMLTLTVVGGVPAIKIPLEKHLRTTSITLTTIRPPPLQEATAIIGPQPKQQRQRRPVSNILPLVYPQRLPPFQSTQQLRFAVDVWLENKDLAVMKFGPIHYWYVLYHFGIVPVIMFFFSVSFCHASTPTNGLFLFL